MRALRAGVHNERVRWVHEAGGRMRLAPPLGAGVQVRFFRLCTFFRNNLAAVHTEAQNRKKRNRVELGF